MSDFESFFKDRCHPSQFPFSSVDYHIIIITTFTLLVFTTTGGMAKECSRYHAGLAQLLATKKGDDYATTMSWMRTKVSLTIFRYTKLCLRGSRKAKKVTNNLHNPELDIELDKMLYIFL